MRGFFQAGATSILLSQWSLSDQGAAVLVPRILAASRDHPEISKAEAVRRAMVSVLSDPSIKGGADPAIWAPFVLVGDTK
jgi:CHAT domain-containing protein